DGKRKRTEEEELEHERNTTTWLGTKVPSYSSTSKTDMTQESTVTSSKRGVGKYMKKVHLDKPEQPTDSEKDAKNTSGYKFGDFSNW
ncbi:hypothetical protein FBU59_006564, partial [Linderina macrospora]